jgi:hypothetical protein
LASKFPKLDLCAFCLELNETKSQKRKGKVQEMIMPSMNNLLDEEGNNVHASNETYHISHKETPVFTYSNSFKISF